jgi:hypothetical protein
MSIPTLADLLQPKDRAEIETILMAALQEATIEGQPGVHFPVTDWNVGSFERTTLKMIATAYLDAEWLKKALVSGGFMDLAIALTDANGATVEGWAERLAAQFYKRARLVAGFAQQMLTLTCEAGTGPYHREALEIVAQSPSTGNRYLNVGAVDIPDGGSISLIFQAESPGAGYQDAIGSIIALVTPMPGVSVTNAATVAGTPASYITGSGSLAVTSTTITTQPRSIAIKFVAGGRVSDGSAKFTATVYQGTSVTTVGPLTATDTYVQGDVTITLTDGAVGTQSFNVGDRWVVGVPGTPLVQAGYDKEQLTALAQRCSDRWPELSDTMTGTRWEGMVRACNASLQIGIVKVKSRPSTDVAGMENVYIAGSTATATPTQVATVQEWLDQRTGQLDGADVIAATAVPITPGGTVLCRRGTTAAVKTAADAAWTAYIADLDIGGQQPGGLVQLAELERVLKNGGAFNFSGLTLNGSAADVELDEDGCATIADSPSGLPSVALTWKEVSS